MIGSLTMSNHAAEEMGLILIGHGHQEISEPAQFGPIVAKTVSDFLSSVYFSKSEWFRRQAVHRTSTLCIKHSDGDVVPIFHLQKTEKGYSIVSSEEAPLSDNYFEERVMEEVRVETGIV